MPSSLLAPYGGERPPAPSWFTWAIERTPERSRFDCRGASIELLTWGELGQPGLLFLHGNSAHADWWSFIAPFFADTHRCAAISWSGMGGSDWREEYSLDLFAREALTAIEVAGLDRGDAPPVIVSHSFGGLPFLYVASRTPTAISAGIMIDSILPPKRAPVPRQHSRDLPRYDTLAQALARFRFSPEQPSDHPAIVDFIARGSLRHVEQEGEGIPGWTWRFDPALWQKMDRSQFGIELAEVLAPIGLIYGEKSVVVGAERVADAVRSLPNCRFATAIPEAGHHIMADQPLALIASLRTGLPRFAG